MRIGAATVARIAGALVPAIALAAQAGAAPDGGESLDRALAALQRDGLNILYSSAVVTPGMRAAEAPAARDPRARAEALLAPYGLRLLALSDTQYVVVPAPATTREPTAPARISDAAALEDIVVTASRYRLDGPSLGQSRVTGPEIESRPLLADDALRSTAALPGVASADTSAPPHLRGGAQNQTLVLLDGYPLRSAYHLPGFRSPFGLVDPALVDVMDVYTGAFPARFGSRMSGVIDIRTPAAPATSEYALGIDVFNALARGAGPISNVNGLDWTALARIGTLGATLHALSPETARPRTADGYARLQWNPSPGRTTSVQMLASTDELKIGDTDGAASRADVETRFDALWLHHAQPVTDSHSIEAWIGYSRLAESRQGELLAPRLGVGSLTSDRDAHWWDARVRWTWQASSDRIVEAGIDFADGVTAYDARSDVQYGPLVLASFARTPDVFQTTFDATRRSAAAYVSQRWRIGADWHADLGIRAERLSRAKDAAESSWEPRLSLRWQPLPAIVARIAWGRHGQPDDVSEIPVPDGARGFSPAQRSEHWVAGVEASLPFDQSLRIELFRKREFRPQPRYENLFDTLAIVPEVAADRVRIAPDAAELQGAEASVRGARGDWQWWGSYTYAHAFDEFASGEVARSWDQRHAITAGLRWQHARWTVAGSGSVHSGWPTTSVIRQPDGTLRAGPRNGARLGRYETLDVRAAYVVPLAHGALQANLQLTNLLDRRNPCCAELEATEPPVAAALEAVPRYSLPLLPSVGILWTF